MWGHAPPENFWNFEAMKYQYNASRRPDIMQNWFQLTDHLLILQAAPFADEACKTIIICLEEQKAVERLGRVLLHCSHPSRKFQHVVCWAMVLIGNAKQVTGKGKSDGWMQTYEFGLMVSVTSHTHKNQTVSYHLNLFFFFRFFEPNRTPSGKNMMTEVQVVIASKVQSIGCRWQVIRGQTFTNGKPMGMKGAGKQR